MADIFQAKRWLLHNQKRPHYITGELRKGNLEEDSDKLATYEEALEASMTLGYGLGFALGKDGDGYWQGIDFDHVSEHPENSEKIEMLTKLTYCEKSPSGDGIHAIGYGKPFPSKGSDKSGIEAYCQGRFFTFTGKAISGPTITDISDALPYVLGRPIEALVGPSTVVLEAICEDLSDEQYSDLQNALTYLDASEYNSWVNHGMALKRHGESGYALWMEWSATDPKFSENEARRKWNSFAPSTITIASIFHSAKLCGYSKIKARVNGLRITSAEDYSEVEEIIDGHYEGGIGNISAGYAVGKTQSLITLCAVVTGELTDTYLKARPPRKVLYVVENATQAHIIRKKMMEETASEEKPGWFNIATAHRGTAEDISEYISLAIKELTTEYNGFPVKPLIVLDTSNANFDLESENDSAEVGSMIAAIKELQGHCWIVSHVAKSDSKASSARGSGAWGADVDWTASMTRQEGDYIATLSTHKVRLVEQTQVRFRGEVTFTEFTDKYGYVRTKKEPWSIILEEGQTFGEPVGVKDHKHAPAILALLEKGSTTIYKIKQELNISGTTCKAAMNSLLLAGKAGQNSDGTYKLA